MKVGILGTGFGGYHAELCKKIEIVEDIIIYGRNNEKLKALQQKLGVRITNNLDEILNDEDIELIDVCLPSAIHKEYVIMALQKGKHVYCETPVALTLEDAIEMKEAEITYGKKVFIDLFIRFEYSYSYLQDICVKQTYGKLKSFQIQRKTPPLWGDLGLDKITTNLMIHDLDFITWLLGKPKQINALGVSGKVGQSVVSSLMQYDDAFAEIVGSSMMSYSYPFAVSYEAVLEEAVVRYYEDGYSNSTVKSLQLFTANGKEEVQMNEDNCYESAMRYVISCIKEGKPYKNDINEAIPSLELALLINKQIGVK